MTADRLAGVFTVEVVRQLATPRVFERGVAYLHDGRVEPEESSGSRFRARVRGTMPYTVRLWGGDGELGWSCTCPAADDGSFCKHCTAAALSLGADARPSGGLHQADSRTVPPTELEEVADFVAGLHPRQLVKVVLSAMRSNRQLRDQLLAEARAARDGRPDLSVWHRRVDKAFAAYGRFVDYHGARGWSEGIHEMIDALETLGEDGHHDAVAELAEYAYIEADKAVEYVDDSDGWLLGIAERLSELHLSACEQGSVDPVALAGRLLRLELHSELGGFNKSAASYAGILGAEGLAAFRAGLEPLLDRVGADDGTAGSESFVEVCRIEWALQGWALGTGDPDIVVKTYERGLRSGRRLSPGGVLDIARALMRAGREDEAIARARRGIAENSLSSWHTADLRDFLADALRRRGDDQAAEELHWQAFAADPSVGAYRRLLEEAASASEWQRRCADALRSHLETSGPVDGAPDARTPSRAGISERVAAGAAAETLIAILLYEGRADDAWAAAEEFGCQQQTRLTLARAREKTHPIDAVEAYEPEIFAQISRTKTSAYRSAVALMERVRQLTGTAGEPERFQRLLERVRTEHPRKRSLHKLLNDRQW